MLLGPKLDVAKVKSACGTKLAEFRKMFAIYSSFIKTFRLFLVKDLTNWVHFSSDDSFREHIFFG